MMRQLLSLTNISIPWSEGSGGSIPQFNVIKRIMAQDAEYRSNKAWQNRKQARGPFEGHGQNCRGIRKVHIPLHHVRVRVRRCVRQAANSSKCSSATGFSPSRLNVSILVSHGKNVSSACDERSVSQLRSRVTNCVHPLHKASSPKSVMKSQRDKTRQRSCEKWQK